MRSSITTLSFSLLAAAQPLTAGSSPLIAPAAAASFTSCCRRHGLRRASPAPQSLYWLPPGASPGCRSSHRAMQKARKRLAASSGELMRAQQLLNIAAATCHAVKIRKYSRIWHPFEAWEAIQHCAAFLSPPDPLAAGVAAFIAQARRARIFWRERDDAARALRVLVVVAVVQPHHTMRCDATRRNTHNAAQLSVMSECVSTRAAAAAHGVAGSAKHAKEATSAPCGWHAALCTQFSPLMAPP